MRHKSLMQRYNHSGDTKKLSNDEQRLGMELQANKYHISDLSWFSLRLRKLPKDYTDQVLITFLKPIKMSEVKKRIHPALRDL